jgi:cytochrome c oxidase subunit 2
MINMKFVLKLSFLLPAILISLLGVAGAEERTTNLYWTPPNVTVGGEQIDRILHFILYLTLFVFFAVNIVFLYYLIKYRRRPGVKAYYSHGNNTLEFIWTVIPTAIFLFLAVWSNRVWFDLHSEPPEDSLRVDIVSYQYGWDMRYAGLDGVLGEATSDNFGPDNRFGLVEGDPASRDDFESTELVIPANRPVHVFLRSRDVIHSFYVPEFRLYQDAVPGRTIGWVWFEVTRPGNFELACSQLCGTGHYNMKARIRVLPPEEFDAWYAEKAEAAQQRAAAREAEESAASLANL